MINKFKLPMKEHKNILPFWDSEVEEVVVGGKKKVLIYI